MQLDTEEGPPGLAGCCMLPGHYLKEQQKINTPRRKKKKTPKPKTKKTKQPKNPREQLSVAGFRRKSAKINPLKTFFMESR